MPDNAQPVKSSSKKGKRVAKAPDQQDSYLITEVGRGNATILLPSLIGPTQTTRRRRIRYLGRSLVVLDVLLLVSTRVGAG